MKFEILEKKMSTWGYNDNRVSRQEGHIIYDAVIRLGAKNIVDLGTGKGTITACLGAAAEEVGGHVDTCDIEKGSAVNFKLAKVKKRLGKLNLVDYITFYVIDDLVLAKEYKKPIDLLAIDTSHTYEQTKKELEAFIPMLSTTGEVFLHDCIYHNRWGPIVNNAVVDYLKSRHRISFISKDVKTLNYEIIETACGLGRIYQSSC